MRPIRIDWRAAFVGGGALAGAGMLGLLAARSPLLALGGAVAIVYFFVVLENLLIGVVALGVLSTFDTLVDVGPLSLIKAAGFVLALSWFAVAMTRPREELLTARPVLTYALLAFLAWVVLSVVWVKDIGAWSVSVIRYVPNLALLLVLYSAVRSRHHLTTAVTAVLAGAVIAAVLGVVSPPTAEFYYATARATGVVDDANKLAASSVVGFVLGCGLAGVFPPRSLARKLAMVAAAACLFSVFATFSRGGIVSLGAALLATMAFGGRWRVVGVIAALVVGLAATTYFADVASYEARDRVSSFSNSTGRTDLWTIGMRMAADKPITGVGAGNFIANAPAYLLQPGVIERGDLVLETPKPAHNLYVEAAAELGFVGLGLLLAIIAAALWSMTAAAQAFDRLEHRASELVLRSLFVATVAALGSNLFISGNYSTILWFLLALGPAALGVARRMERVDLRPRTDNEVSAPMHAKPQRG